MAGRFFHWRMVFRLSLLSRISAFFRETTIAALLIALSASALGQEIERHPTRDDVLGTKKGDAELAEAAEQARKTLITFVRSLQNPREGTRYLLKVKIQEGDAIEFMWLEPVKWQDPGLCGILANAPVELKKHKRGDAIYPLPDDIADWVILSPDGSKLGGYTIDVLDKREKKKEQNASDKP